MKTHYAQTSPVPLNIYIIIEKNYKI